MIPARHRPSMPFHTFSSFNKKGGRTHPKVARTRNKSVQRNASAW